MNTKPSGFIINLGRAQGIITGQQIVILRRLSEKSTPVANTEESFYENIAIGEVVQVSDLSAKAVIVHKISLVSQGDQVKTFIDKEKLIRLITQTRKELDTQKRLKPKKRVILMEPKAGKVSTEYSNWSYSYQQTKEQHDRWLFSTAGTGGATILLLSGVIKMSGALSVLPWIAGAGTVYTGIRYLHYRDLMDELSTKGRSKGFISSSFNIQHSGWHLNPVSQAFKLTWVKRF